MPKIRRLDKLPKRKVTIDEILDLTDKQEIIDILIENKDKIGEILVIYTIDGEINWTSNGMVTSRFNYLLDRVKHCTMREIDG